MLELLNSIGRAEPGIRLLVCDPVTARDAESGACSRLDYSSPNRHTP
jgi:hypothetical protein